MLSFQIQHFIGPISFSLSTPLKIWYTFTIAYVIQWPIEVTHRMIAIYPGRNSLFFNEFPQNYTVSQLSWQKILVHDRLSLLTVLLLSSGNKGYRNGLRSHIKKLFWYHFQSNLFIFHTKKYYDWLDLFIGNASVAFMASCQKTW